MIINGILSVFNGLVSASLLPLEALNLGIDFILSIPIVTQFLQIVAYVLPWANLVPLFFLIVSIFQFRIGLALIKTIFSFIPFMRWLERSIYEYFIKCISYNINYY